MERAHRGNLRASANLRRQARSADAVERVATVATPRIVADEAWRQTVLARRL